MTTSPDELHAIRREAAPHIVLEMAMSAVLAGLAIDRVDEDAAVDQIVRSLGESALHSPAERAFELVRRGQDEFKCFYKDQTAAAALEQMAVLVVDEVPDAVLDQWFEVHAGAELV